MSLGQEHNWSRFRSPEEVGNEKFYRLNPMVLAVHAEDDRRALSVQYEDDHIRYTVLSDPDFPEDDPTQSNWRMDYGAEFYFDGSSIEFLNVPETVEDPESYARSIAEDIFPELEERSLEYYSRRLEA